MPQALMQRATPVRAGQKHWQAGIDHLARHNWSAAAEAFTRATRSAPQDAVYWLNLANAQRRGGDAAAAEAAARQVLRLRPSQALALQILGDALAQQHRYAESVEVLAALEAAGTQEPEAMLRHGSMLLALQRPREAFEVLMKALALKPTLVRGHAVLADACRDLGLKREAVECMKTVLALDPHNLEALNHLSFEKRHLADWTDFDADVARIADALATSPPGLARVTAAFGTLSLPLPPALQRVAAEQESAAIAWAAQPLPALRPDEIALRRQRHAAGERLRIGWVSHDFREHPVSQLLVEPLERMDRTRFEHVLYSSGPDDGSALRQRLAAAADRFIDIRGLADAEAARRIRNDGIDILIDLMGHTRGHRLGVFAARPAPLQLGFLGYPGTTGATFIDGFVGDAIAAPAAHAAHFSEQLVHIEGCFQPNGRWRPLPRSMGRAEAGLPEGAFVMCAFNHTYKIGPAAFDLWCRVLRQVPHAVLWLKETNRQLHDNVRREAAARGVEPSRIVFAPVVSYEDHFSRLALADVFVDTAPYGAHTTAADALWAGVPVLTCPGESFASRVATSVLAAVGLHGLAMETPGDVEAALVTMAQDPCILAGIREHLQTHRLALPLFDSAGYARRFEAMLEQVWGHWCSPVEGAARDARMAPRMSEVN